MDDRKTFKCKICNNNYFATYFLRRRNRPCPDCRKKEIELSYQKLALQKNCKIIKLNKNRQLKSTWQCNKCNYIWDTAYYTLIQCLNGCPDCAKHRRKNSRTEEDYRRLGLKYDLILIKMTPDVNKKSTWKCDQGHIYEATFTNIKNNGRSCMKCSGKTPKTEEDYIKLAAEKGLKYLGPFPSATNQKTYWICKCGKELFNNYQRINMNRLCEKCGRAKQSGKNHYQYNPNLTEEQRVKKRLDFDVTEWTKMIYKNFNYICFKCDLRVCYSNKPNAHHIYNWNDYPDLRTNKNNGILLCTNCHKEFHKNYGKRFNNIEQLINFIPKKKEILIEIKQKLSNTKIDLNNLYATDYHKGWIKLTKLEKIKPLKQINKSKKIIEKSLICENGEIIKILNLKNFCKENNYNYDFMIRLFRPKNDFR